MPFGRGASRALYDALAPTYEEHFAVPHRRAYDDLPWNLVHSLLPAPPGRIVDVGCGVGRCARRLVDLGHTVVGIEPAPAMAALARERVRSTRFELVERLVEEAELPSGHADLVPAMGSLQYTEDPEWVLQRIAAWVRPGGAVVVLVDSLVALVLELLATGKEDEALERLETRRGVWTQDGRRADNHLVDAERLRVAFQGARLTGVEVRGLLAGWSAFGRADTIDRLTRDRARHLALERRLSASPVLADVAKQLYAVVGCPRAEQGDHNRAVRYPSDSAVPERRGLAELFSADRRRRGFG